MEWKKCPYCGYEGDMFIRRGLCHGKKYMCPKCKKKFGELIKTQR